MGVLERRREGECVGECLSIERERERERMAVCRLGTAPRVRRSTGAYSSRPVRSSVSRAVAVRAAAVMAVSVGAASSRVSVCRGARVIVRAEPESVEEKIKEAVEVCDTEDAAKCAEAWDEVEEVSAAAADKREKEKANQDPLEKYCESAPDADECRVYED